jgi:hypothetical protein
LCGLRLGAGRVALGSFGGLAVLGGAAHDHVAAQAGRGLVGQDDDGAVGLELAAHA